MVLLTVNPPSVSENLVSEIVFRYLRKTITLVTANGEIVPLLEEYECLAKEQTIQRAERLEEILRSQGLAPDQLPA